MKLQFESGEYLNSLAFAHARIVTIDSAREVASIEMLDDSQEVQTIDDVPFYFHCEQDAQPNDVGGLERAVNAFNVGDEVVVMFKDGQPKIIANLTEKRACGNNIYFFLDNTAYVFDVDLNLVDIQENACPRFSATDDMLELKQFEDIIVLKRQVSPGYVFVYFFHKKNAFKESIFNMTETSWSFPGDKYLTSVYGNTPLYTETNRCAYHITSDTIWTISYIYGDLWSFGKIIYDKQGSLVSKNFYYVTISGDWSVLSINSDGEATFLATDGSFRVYSHLGEELHRYVCDIDTYNHIPLIAWAEDGNPRFSPRLGQITYQFATCSYVQASFTYTKLPFDPQVHTETTTKQVSIPPNGRQEHTTFSYNGSYGPDYFANRWPAPYFSDLIDADLVSSEYNHSGFFLITFKESGYTYYGEWIAPDCPCSYSEEEKILQKEFFDGERNLLGRNISVFAINKYLPVPVWIEFQEEVISSKFLGRYSVFYVSDGEGYLRRRFEYFWEGRATLKIYGTETQIQPWRKRDVGGWETCCDLATDEQPPSEHILEGEKVVDFVASKYGDIEIVMVKTEQDLYIFQITPNEIVDITSTIETQIGTTLYNSKFFGVLVGRIFK